MPAKSAKRQGARNNERDSSFSSDRKLAVAVAVAVGVVVVVGVGVGVAVAVGVAVVVAVVVGVVVAVGVVVGVAMNMKQTAKIIRTNNVVQEVEPKNGKTFSYAELSAIVGGYIEIINAKGSSDSILVLNEDGKIKGLPPNELATKILQESGGMPGDYVVGDCLLCLSSQVK